MNIWKTAASAMDEFPWKSYWIGPLLVLVALLSVAVLQFRTLRSKKSGAACLANSAAASSAVARHVTTGTSTPSDQDEAEHTASAAGKSDIRYSDSVHTATANAGSFSEEFQIALQLKSAHNLAAAETRLRNLACRVPGSDRTKALEELSSVMKLQGNLPECVKVFEELSRHLLVCHGARSARTLKHQIKLGTMYHRCGRLDDAEVTLREALSILQQFHSADNPATLDCLSSLAFLLRHLGRLDDADPMLLSALQGSIRVFGSNHSKTILVRNNYAALLMSRASIAQVASEESAIKLYDEADALMRESLSHQLSTAGESDPITQQTMHNLAALLHARHGDSEEALDLMRRTVRSRSASLGVSNTNTVASHSALITMLLKRGDDGVSEAEELMRSMIAALHSNIDEWIKAVRMLAQHLKSKGTQDASLQAKDLFLELLQRQEHDGCSRESVIETLEGLWDSWFVLGDVASATRVLRRCIKFKLELLGAKHETVLQDQSSLAALLEKNGETRGQLDSIAEAETLYRHVAHMQREVHAGLNCSSCLAMYNLGAFLLVHRPAQQDEAASLLRSAHAGWSVLLGKDHEDTRDALQLLQQFKVAQ